MTLVKGNTFLHFIIHFLLATGLLVALAGLVVWFATDVDKALYVAMAGGGVFALALLGEIFGAVALLTSRRGAVGFNVLLQVLLAASLLAGINFFSLFNYQRWDWTEDGKFTIPAQVRGQLSRLRDETTIVVLQRHASFGQQAGKQDSYDAAAERKIVEKVKDLVELFQELGPKFRVKFLDNQKETFDRELQEIRGETPELAKAIEETPENSIFFFDPEDKKNGAPHIQRLSFHDVYQLDREASQQANDGKGNLVLNYQGLEPFVRKVLNIEEKKPRIGIAVIHPWLSHQSDDVNWGMKGLRKTLRQHAFEGLDIILKTNWQGFSQAPEPAVFTYDEDQYELLETAEARLETIIKRDKEVIAVLEKRLEKFKSATLEELKKEFILIKIPFRRPEVGSPEEAEYLQQKIGLSVRTAPLNQLIRQEYTKKTLPRRLRALKDEVEAEEKELAEIRKEVKDLNIEELAERRRITDVRAKLKRLLSGVDLLVIPRPTWTDALNKKIFWWPKEHHLDRDHIQAIKEFMQAGKPVLFCLGPTNEYPQMVQSPYARSLPQVNELEKMLKQLGFRLPKQVILFDVETKTFADQRKDAKVKEVLVPPVQFNRAGENMQPVLDLNKKRNDERHPLHANLKLTANSIVQDPDSMFRLRNPRPVYYVAFQIPGKNAAALIAAAGLPQADHAARLAGLVRAAGDELVQPDNHFMWTSADSWNEKQPFIIDRELPRLERELFTLSLQDSAMQVERQGPFPVAAAAEIRLPYDWYKDEKKPTTVRLAAIGHGSVFSGPELTPMQEKLFVDTANWLLGRDDLLIQSDPDPWRYPRVHLSPHETDLWQWSTRLGLPLLFAYFGFVMVLVRRLR